MEFNSIMSSYEQPNNTNHNKRLNCNWSERIHHKLYLAQRGPMKSIHNRLYLKTSLGAIKEQREWLPGGAVACVRFVRRRTRPRRAGPPSCGPRVLPTERHVASRTYASPAFCHCCQSCWSYSPSRKKEIEREKV